MELLVTTLQLQPVEMHTQAHFGPESAQIRSAIVQQIQGSQTCNAALLGFLHVQVSRICKISKMDQKYIT